MSLAIKEIIAETGNRITAVTQINYWVTNTERTAYIGYIQKRNTIKGPVEGGRQKRWSDQLNCAAGMSECGECESPLKRTCAAEMSVERKQHRKVLLTIASCLGTASAGKPQHQTETYCKWT
jgi:hypothetical protein